MFHLRAIAALNISGICNRRVCARVCTYGVTGMLLRNVQASPRRGTPMKRLKSSLTASFDWFAGT